MTLRTEHPRAYNSWQAMKQRCLNSNCPAWDDYGGRGISICAEWISDFPQFLADMGDPRDGESLDRHPDNDGDYGPDNCRWATALEQANNRRKAFYANPSGFNLVDRGYLLWQQYPEEPTYHAFVRTP